jgi:hypothetical protein
MSGRREHDIHREIAGREIEVLQALGIEPRRTGHQRCPFADHEDKNPSWRWEGGKRRWYCSCGSGTVVDAVMRAEGIDAAGAIRWIRATVLGDGQAPQPRPRPAPPPANDKAAARQTKPKEDPAVYAREIWAKSVPIADTIAETYLRQHRGISGELPGNLRFCRGLWHKEANQAFPALIVPAFWPDGALARVQAIYLDPATGAKAGLPDGCKVKKTFGAGVSRIPAVFQGALKRNA